MSCPACNEHEGTTFDTKDGHDLIQCSSCGLIYVAPMPEEDFLSAFYDKCAPEGKGERADDYYSEVIDLIESRIPNGARLLDIGCGSGDLLATAQKRGFDVRGIDSSTARVSVALGNHKLNIIHGSFPDERLNDRLYDVVYMGHVIEHLLDPNSFIDRVKEILSPDGLLCIVCPNAGAASFRIRKCRHDCVIFPEHVTYWSGRSLSKFMERQGFKTESLMSRYPDNELKSIISYLLRDAWQKPPSSKVSISSRPFVEGRRGVSVLAYHALKAFSRYTGPLFGKMGGNELIGIFRKCTEKSAIH